MYSTDIRLLDVFLDIFKFSKALLASLSSYLLSPV